MPGLAPVAAAARGRAKIAQPVLDVLIAQNARWGASEQRTAQLDALRRGAVAVVTGQQVGLFLGPLYTLYKAASAVRLAQELTRAGVEAVPLFWIQAEDHDHEEIRSVRWPMGAELCEAKLPARDAARERASLAHELLGDEIAAAVEALGSVGADSGEARAWIERVGAHYRPGVTLPDAFGGLLAELFERFGLLTFQPRDAAVAPLAAELHRRAIAEHGPITSALRERAEDLRARGAKVPIPVRAECTLSFFHPEGAAGPRYRLVPDAEGFALSGSARRVERAEVERCLRESPLAFSTSAMLRPVLQDLLLPTAAYVGGPSEVAYAAQLGPLYEALGVQPAPFLRRASFVITRQADRDALRELGLDRGALATLDEASLLASIGRGPTSAALEQLAAHNAAALDALRGELESLDPGLAKTLTKSRQAIEHSLAKLQARAERANAARQPERVGRLREVACALRPGGAPQERVLGLPAIASLGVARVIDAAIAAARPGAEDGEVELAF